MFLNIRAPTEHELTNLEAIEMTSHLPFEPDTQDILIRRKQYTKKDMQYPGGFSMDQWRKRLAMAPEDVVERRVKLQHT